MVISTEGFTGTHKVVQNSIHPSLISTSILVQFSLQGHNQQTIFQWDNLRLGSCRTMGCPSNI